MKNLITLLTFLLPLAAIAQKGPVQIIDKKDGNTVILIAKNKSKDNYQLDVDLKTKGFGLEPNTHLTEIIPAKSEVEIIRLTPQPGKRYSYSFQSSYQVQETEMEPITAGDSPPTPNAGTLSVAEGEIVVFSKKGCGRCSYALKYLKENDVEFQELNITKSKGNNALMFEKLYESGFSGNSVQTPVILVGSEVFYNINNLQGFLANLAERE